MIFEIILLALASVQAKVTVLLDSTKDSSAGWMLYSSTLQPPTISGWKQEQGEDNSTSYKVCDRNISADVSNWLWTPFMERGIATEITIDIDYRISSCWMPFCKEEFVIFLHDSDSATTQQQLQSWESKDYAQLEQIGWFRRDSGGYVNIKRFGVNKEGFHLAFRDQGSCLSISSIKVYYKSCPETIIDFIHLPETLINEDANSRRKVEVEGECVANAAPRYGRYGPPRRECEENWNGGSPKWEWKTYGYEDCRCKAGYQPDPIKNNVCVPCPIGQFKKEIKLRGDECMQCPPYTEGILPGLEECPCIEGYYRSKDDSADEMCSRPPSSPSNLTVTKVFATTTTLSWSPPLDEGNRTDTRYRVSCDTCGSEVVFIPGNETFQQTSVTITNLNPETSYRFRVFSLNGVSDLVKEEPESAEIVVVTIENKPVHSNRVEELELEVEDLKRKVDRLIDCGGCGDMINPYYN